MTNCVDLVNKIYKKFNSKFLWSEKTYQNYICNIIIEAFFNCDDDDDGRTETRYAVNNLASWILLAVSNFQAMFDQQNVSLEVFWIEIYPVKLFLKYHSIQTQAYICRVFRHTIVKDKSFVKINGKV